LTGGTQIDLACAIQGAGSPVNQLTPGAVGGIVLRPDEDRFGTGHRAMSGGSTCIPVLNNTIPWRREAYRRVDDPHHRVGLWKVAPQFACLGTQILTQQTHMIPVSRKIEVTLVGDYVSPANLAEISSHLKERGMDGTELLVHQVKDNHIDVSSLKSSLLNDLYAQSQKAIEDKDRIIAKLQAERALISRDSVRLKGIASELRILYPDLTDIVVTDGLQGASGTDHKDQYRIALNLQSAKALDAADVSKIEKWIQVKVPEATVKVYIDRVRPSAKRIANH
jgi:hypothetical protein